MADLKFNQIADRLNGIFAGEGRKLVFWYDTDGEFASEVESLELKGAKVYHLEPGSQLRTKILLEREDPETSYLIYAPFPKPDIRDNHLADTLGYSVEFSADWVSLMMQDLGMDESCRPVLQQYRKFFGSKARVDAFKALHIESCTPASALVGMMSVLCKVKVSSFEETVRAVITGGSLENNPLLSELARYGLLDSFWVQCSSVFGYSSEHPSLTGLIAALFVTCAERSLHQELPETWKPFVSPKQGTAETFLENLMNNVLYQDKFDEFSASVWKALDGENELKNVSCDALADCFLFAEIDERILQWMVKRILNEDVYAKLANRTIPEICSERRKMHFGQRYSDAYCAVENAWNLALPRNWSTPRSPDNHLGWVGNLVSRYTDELYRVDQYYRCFYLHYDRLEDSGPYEELRSRVERIYSNDYLATLLPEFSAALKESEGNAQIPRQFNFYASKVRDRRQRSVVIISDAMRYEVGVSLFERLKEYEKGEPKISVMQSTLPSVTRVGMAALLPHSTLTVEDADSVLADGLPTVDLKQREAVLKRSRSASRAVQFDTLMGMSVEELRNVFRGQDAVYIYHNQIDARGDKLATENEVFAACEEAIDEICRLIHRLTTSANVTSFLITSDHGFLYRRDKLTGSDKISGIPGASDRYAITEQPLKETGVCSFPLSKVCGCEEDGRFVNLPVGADLFTAPGSGKNYVHGGCSPQEMLIPVIEVKTVKANVDTADAQLQLLSLLKKVTNLHTKVDFFQPEAVSDVVKAAEYRAWFESDTGEKITGEQIVKADLTDEDAGKRVLTLKFTFKNRTYGMDHKYYLVVANSTGLQVLRKEVIIDIPFADDYGF